MVPMKKPKKPTWDRTSLPGYPTLGRYVFLGRVSPEVRKRAVRAGLIVLTAKRFRLHASSMASISRIMVDGTWYDTVRYP